LCRLATTDRAVGEAADVLELAYALRWLELGPDPCAEESADMVSNWVLDE
jgi:hypothetical protein